MMARKILVVGGAGYIGGSVTDELMVRQIPFAVYDNLTYENHYLKPVEFVYGDVRDREKLGRLLPHYSHVVWLAAIVGDGACAIRPDLTRAVNEESVAWLAAHYDGRIVFTSTCSVYGANDRPVTEQSPTNPLSVYAQTKLGAERHLLGKHSLIFRLGTAFGLSDTYARIRMDLAVNYMTMNGVIKKKLTVYGGDQWRPFIHVRDIARAIVDNLDAPHAGVFNLATQNETILSVAKRISAETGCEVAVTDQKFQDNRNYHADTTKGRRAGVMPDTTDHTIEYGIREVKQLVLSHRINDLEHEFYSNQKHLLKAIAKYEHGMDPTPS